MADLGSTKVFGKLTVIHEAVLKANAEITGDVNVSGIITGDGSGLTTLNASNLSSGTVAEARLPASALVGDTTYSAGTGITLTDTTFSLTDEAYTSAEKTKLAGIESGAEVNVVDSVAGKTGAVALDTDDVSEGTNLYHTDARARGAISVSGDLSYSASTGVISFNETYSSAAEVKTAYESNADTNAFTDALQSKLDGISDGADNYGGWSLNTDGVSRGNIASSESVDFVGGTNVSLDYNATGNVITISATDTNTTYTAGTGLTLSGTTFSLTNEAYTTTEKDKLAGIESGATADQTSSEILTAIKSVDGSGSGLDADLLDGHQADEFQLIMPTSNHSGLAVGWYTIATNSGNRAIARFGLRDTDSSDHQSCVFYASHHYGAHSELTVLHSGRYSGTPLRYIRIKEGGTYDGAMLQVYIDHTSHSVQAFLYGENFQSSGWTIKDWVPDDTDPGGLSNYSALTNTAAQIDLDNIMDGGMATTGQMYIGGSTTQNKVWHAGNDGSGSGLDADLLDGQHASEFASASHTHNYDNYGSWTVSDGTNSEAIGSGNTLTINGTGATTATYDAASNTLTIDSTDTNTDTTYTAGTGLTLSGGAFSLSDEQYTTTEKNKLAGIESGAEVNTVTSVAGKTGAVTVTQGDVGLGNVRNVSSYSQIEADGNFLGKTAKASDSDLLDGQDGSHYLDYNNLSNTPSTLPCYMGPTPPTPSSGLLWFDTEDATLNIWYDDGTSGQWVGLNGSDGEAEDVVPITLALG